MARSASSGTNEAAMRSPPVGTIRKNISITDGSTSSTVHTRYARYFPSRTAARGIGRVNR